jgi:ubiquinone/menaquinone biosynthesis C-methylase UbiE
MVSTRSQHSNSKDGATEHQIDRVEYTPSHTLFTDMQVLKAMWFPSIKGSTHQEQLESFYKTQAHLYDSYRCRMLHGRKPLVQSMPASSGDVWVDLGGGTGSNLEFFGAKIIEFKKVVVVDLTPSLVQVNIDAFSKRLSTCRCSSRTSNEGCCLQSFAQMRVSITVRNMPDSRRILA